VISIVAGDFAPMLEFAAVAREHLVELLHLTDRVFAGGPDAVTRALELARAFGPSVAADTAERKADAS
jgi:hypothetical protein